MTRRPRPRVLESAEGQVSGARLRNWLSVRHSLRVEAAAVLVLYAVYESSRGLVASDAGGRRTRDRASRCRADTGSHADETTPARSRDSPSVNRQIAGL